MSSKEAYATYEDQKLCWEMYELTGRKVIHLKPGDILMKKNFGEDKEPGGLEGIISWAQKTFSHRNTALANTVPQPRQHGHDAVLASMFPGVDLDGPPARRKTNNNLTTEQISNREANRKAKSFNTDPFADSQGEDTGDWATGHVAVAVSPVRLAEQTGTGVMINTLNVTAHHIQEHNVANVYYYVYRCNNPAVAKNAAILAESFAASRPLKNRSTSPTFTKGNYTLLPASAAVLGTASLRKRTYNAGDRIKLDKFSQNILNFCLGIEKQRTAMYCSAFVLAVYQAACVLTLGDEVATSRRYLLDLDPTYILPRHYEGALRQNKAGYTFEGTFRWKNLDREHKAQNVLEQLQFNFSQAIDNYANQVSVGHGGRGALGGAHLTGIGKVSLTKTNQTRAAELIQRKKKEMNARRQAAHLSMSNNSKFRAFFKRKDDNNKDATDLDALNELAADNAQTYNNLYQLRLKAHANLQSDDKTAAMNFFSACEAASRANADSLLKIHLQNAMEANNAHSAMLQNL